MQNSTFLKVILSTFSEMPDQRLAVFALLVLGILESLANGLLSTNEALRVFFHTENCFFVRKELRHEVADAIMSHGVQLPDSFEALPIEEAHQEFQRELATMRTLCLKLIEENQLATFV